MDWARAPQRRDQLVMFPTRLDDAIGSDHVVRLLDEIFGRIDWSGWEAEYDLTRGQPPIHPRVLAGVILYGLLMRLRSTRMLEEATRVRIDFIWLLEGLAPDHSTIAGFVTRHAERLKVLFTDSIAAAASIGLVRLRYVAVDGTKIRANASKSAAVRLGRSARSAVPCTMRRSSVDVGTHFARRRAAVLSHMASSLVRHGLYSVSAPWALCLARAMWSRPRTTTLDVAPSVISA